jgi:D-alanyl-D-alanine carboxypeptidase
MKIFFISLICLFSSTVTINVYADTTNTQTQIQKVVEQTSKQFDITALSLAILTPNQTAPLAYTYGNKQLKSQNPITAETLFQMGSITKTFTAQLTIAAIQARKLSPSGTLGEYLPQYPKWKNITITQLLNQTSGIYDYDQSKNWWGNLSEKPTKIWTSPELVDIAYSYPNVFLPGTSWEYSNTNYVLLGMILEKKLKQPLLQSMLALFQDANLKNTYYLTNNYSASMLGNMAHGYYNNQFDETDLNGSWLQAAGAIVSTPTDMVNWFHYFITKTKAGKLLMTTMLYPISKDQTMKNNMSIEYGYGVFRLHTSQGMVYFVPGLTSGYTSAIVYVPCLNTYFAYSASRAPLKNFHKQMITQVLNILNNDEALKQTLASEQLPAFC